LTATNQFLWIDDFQMTGVAVDEGVPPAAPLLGYAFDGTSLTLSWPLDYVGWQLEAQTNSSAMGLGTNWFVMGGVVSNTAILPVNGSNGSAFFRLHSTGL
jgi:hypothetical protein